MQAVENKYTLIFFASKLLSYHNREEAENLLTYVHVLKMNVAVTRESLNEICSCLFVLSVRSSLLKLTCCSLP